MGESREGQPISLKQKVIRGVGIVAVAGAVGGQIFREPVGSALKKAGSAVTNMANAVADWDNKNFDAQTERSRKAEEQLETAQNSAYRAPKPIPTLGKPK